MAGYIDTEAEWSSSRILAQSAVHYLGTRDACVGGGAGDLGRGVGAGEEGGPRPGRHQQHRQH